MRSSSVVSLFSASVAVSCTTGLAFLTSALAWNGTAGAWVLVAGSALFGFILLNPHRLTDNTVAFWTVTAHALILGLFFSADIFGGPAWRGPRGALPFLALAAGPLLAGVLRNRLLQGVYLFLWTVWALVAFLQP